MKKTSLIYHLFRRMESTSFLVRFSSHPSNGSLVSESQTCPDLLPLRRRRKRGRTLPPSINTTITITIIVFGVTVVMLVRSGCFFFVLTILYRYSFKQPESSVASLFLRAANELGTSLRLSIDPNLVSHSKPELGVGSSG